MPWLRREDAAGRNTVNRRKTVATAAVLRVWLRLYWRLVISMGRRYVYGGFLV